MSVRSGAITISLGILGGAVLLLVAVLLQTSDIDTAALRGIGLGAVLGALNLGLGSWLTGRAIRRSNRAVMGTVLGGFFARLALLCGLVLYFQTQVWINEQAFAVAFMIFFILFLMREVHQVETSLRVQGRRA